MKKIHKDSAGVGALAVILGILVVAGVGFAGWSVWQNKNDAITETNTPVSTPSPSNQTYKRTTSVPSDWKKFENTTYHLSFSYPANWKAVDNLAVSQDPKVLAGPQRLSPSAAYPFVISLKNQSLDTAATEYRATFSKTGNQAPTSYLIALCQLTVMRLRSSVPKILPAQQENRQPIRKDRSVDFI